MATVLPSSLSHNPPTNDLLQTSQKIFNRVKQSFPTVSQNSMRKNLPEA